jgi:hypothetical protein
VTFANQTIAMLRQRWEQSQESLSRGFSWQHQRKMDDNGK